METQTATGLGEKRFLGKIHFQIISVEKLLMFHRTNRCLGCVGYVYVGRIYQNRGVFVLVISNINIALQKLLTLPLTETGRSPIQIVVLRLNIYQYEWECAHLCVRVHLCMCVRSRTELRCARYRVRPCKVKTEMTCRRVNNKVYYRPVL